MKPCDVLFLTKKVTTHRDQVTTTYDLTKTAHLAVFVLGMFPAGEPDGLKDDFGLIQHMKKLGWQPIPEGSSSP